MKNKKKIPQLGQDLASLKMTGGFALLETNAIVLYGGVNEPVNNCDWGTCPTNNCKGGNCGNCVAGCGVKD